MKRKLPDFAQMIPEKEKINYDLIEKFILVANKKLKKGNFALNTHLDKIPELNDSEFNVACEHARKFNIKIIKTDDNCQSSTYYFETINSIVYL